MKRSDGTPARHATDATHATRAIDDSRPASTGAGV